MNTSIDNKEIILINDYIETATNLNMGIVINKPLTKNIFNIIKQYIKNNNVCVYGGTAINNILPEGSRFYNKKIDMPDYDLFSPNAMEVAKQIADLYFKKGYTSVEAKSSVYKNTYKIFVNYIPVADITRMDKSLFDELIKKSIVRKGINYAPANFLRMLLYLELSRPRGYVSRWNKVVSRLNLLNKHYPIETDKCDKYSSQQSINLDDEKKIFNLVKNTLISQKAIFIGGFAGALYSQYFPKSKQEKVMPYLDFDVIHKNPTKIIHKIKHELEGFSGLKITIEKHEAIDTILSINYDILINNKKILGIFKPIACHTFNNIRLNDKIIRVASIETLFNFYLAFLYAKHDNTKRILCFCNNLFKLRKKHRTAKRGLVNRFSLKCYGKQTTVQDMIEEKSKMYNQLKLNKNNEYNKWFLKYVPVVHKRTRIHKRKHKDHLTESRHKRGRHKRGRHKDHPTESRHKDSRHKDSRHKRTRKGSRHKRTHKRSTRKGSTRKGSRRKGSRHKRSSLKSITKKK
jgi:hypothetical protein